MVLERDPAVGRGGSAAHEKTCRRALVKLQVRPGRFMAVSEDFKVYRDCCLPEIIVQHLLPISTNEPVGRTSVAYCATVAAIGTVGAIRFAIAPTKYAHLTMGAVTNFMRGDKHADKDRPAQA